MWSPEQLREILPGIEPRSHSFTYTYPPPYLAKQRSNRGGASLSAINEWPDLTAYLHIPFCGISCNFCSLHRQLATSYAQIAEYTQCLLHELESFGGQVSSPVLKALYIGGGTPSTVDPYALGSLLDRLSDLEDKRTAPEVTMECAPDTDRNARDWIAYLLPLASRRTLPITRVSVGVQAWDEKILKRMGRNGTLGAAIETLTALRTLGLDYNIDFLLGYPRNAPHSAAAEAADILKALDHLDRLGLKPPSVSIYQLWDVAEIPATRQRPAEMPSGDELAKALWSIQSQLYDTGYQQGAGTTFIAGVEYLHNWTVHRCREFRHVGFGSGSYSFHPTGLVQRERNIAKYQEIFSPESASWIQADRYLNSVYRLTSEDVEMRRVIAGLRSGQPIPAPRAAGQPTPHIQELKRKIRYLIDVEILSLKNGLVALHPNAFMLTNAVSNFLHPLQVPRRP
jgi:coproporphyrinogen III oxidase-like Fe-S oxidoreductase